jgi:hypothetical protein
MVAMACAVLLTQRRLPRAVWVIAAGVVVFVTLPVWAAFDYVTSESSTAPLVFLFGPAYQFLAVGFLPRRRCGGARATRPPR